MTVSAAYAPLLFNGNDVTVDLPVTWPFFTGSLVVTAIDADGVETLQTISTHYTVTGGTGATGLPSTGTVTMLVAPATGTQIRIERSVPMIQDATFNTNDAFPSKVVEAALDKLTLSVQEVADSVEPLPAAEASMFIGWNDAGTALENKNAADFNLTIGTVTTGAPGSSASATLSGTATEAVLDLTIPRGATGASGGGTGDVVAANNLSDLASVKTAFDNLSIRGADIASAATVNLEAATGNLVDVTGTTTWTAVTLADGHECTVRHTGIQTLTHGASLVLLTGANITTASGDFSIWRGYAAGVVRMTDYARASGAALAGVAANSVTNAMLSDVATVTFKGRTTGGTGDPEDLTATQATAMLNVFDSTHKGLVSASGGGTTTFARADGTWAVPAGSVTTVAIVGGAATAGEYLASCTASFAGSTWTLTFTKAVDQDTGGGGGGTCFPAGCMVLMADMTWREITAVNVGDLVFSPLGAEVVREAYVTNLGRRKLYVMADGSLIWSSEHTFMVKRETDTWLWTMDREQLQAEQEMGIIGGLVNWPRLMEGKANVSERFAHVSGWKSNTPIHIKALERDRLPLYLPLTANGGLIVVNGYLVGASVDENKCDYGAIDWKGIA
jgi:hypothetical protein